MLAVEVAFDEVRSLLTAAQISQQVFLQLVDIRSAFSSNGVGLDVLVEKFIRVEFGAVGWKREEFDSVGVRFDPRLHLLRLVNRVTVKNQKDLLLHAFHQSR